MIDATSTWVAAIWTALTFFIAGNIEPLPGVWIAATSGALLSAFTGPDKGLCRMAVHIILAVLVGVFSSQIIAEVVALKVQARVAEAFFCALFAEKIVAGIHSGALFRALTEWRRGK